ncbi:hypothetical protein BHF95_09040 [Corynebacterium diphtheriae]|nr:hypothetical protein BGK40_11015 [Corynebacterium diphtheriae]OIS20766.1 hypothetical protein BHF95_09040 [Corynebacterium diphtheriae]OLN12234.1 hypothetical protein BUE62_11540 [Corynebacterium diphtheriae]
MNCSLLVELRNQTPTNREQFISAIVGGVIFARWGSKKGHADAPPALDKLPEDMRTGIISLPDQRPRVGRTTTSPSSIEPIALHMAALAVMLFLANILTNWVNDAFPALSFPLFAMAYYRPSPQSAMRR